MAEGVSLAPLSMACHRTEEAAIQSACAGYPRSDLSASGGAVYDTCTGGFGAIQYTRYQAGQGDIAFVQANYWTEPCELADPWWNLSGEDGALVAAAIAAVWLAAYGFKLLIRTLRDRADGD